MRCHPKRAFLFLLYTSIVIVSLRVLHDEILLLTPTDPYCHHDNRDNLLQDKKMTLRVWPRGRNETDDRIPAQIAYIPSTVKPHSPCTKVILIYNGLEGSKAGRRQFRDDQCLVQQCFLSENRELVRQADAILFHYSLPELARRNKPHNQVWIMSQLESPINTPSMDSYHGLVNWTATYRRDSTIVTPYERWLPSLTNDKQQLNISVKNYALYKKRKVAWFVSNCFASNGRWEYAMELGKYIDIDIYGDCGNYSCSRLNDNTCGDVLKRNYKFYLAFENSNCRDYITEKLYWNAFRNDVVPIVMGAHPMDYQLSCPPHSYIHVDNIHTPAKLAEYLHKLDKDDDMYNEYFHWKGTGEFINTKFWCRLCALLHDRSRVSVYSDVDEWWRGGSTCVNPAQDMKWATWRGVDISNYNISHKDTVSHNSPAV